VEAVEAQHLWYVDVTSLLCVRREGVIWELVQDPNFWFVYLNEVCSEEEPARALVAIRRNDTEYEGSGIWWPFRLDRQANKSWWSTFITWGLEKTHYAEAHSEVAD
jgi:hypothetical protein